MPRSLGRSRSRPSTGRISTADTQASGIDLGILAVLDHIRAWPGFAGLDWKESAADAPPFARMKVRLKAEIVTMGQPDMYPSTTTGHYVAPRDWNALIADPDTVPAVFHCPSWNRPAS